MKICMVTSASFPPEEGIGYYIYNLSRNLINKGHEVVVITRGSWKKTQRDFIDNIELIRASFIPIYPFYIYVHGLFANKIFKSIESQIDVVHFHTPLPPIIKTSLPTLLTVHTPMLTDTRSIEVNDFRATIEKLMGRFVSYPLELNLLKRADIITTVAKSVALELKDYGQDKKNVIVIGNGVDERIFIPIKNKNRNRYILFTGRLAYRKGLFDLIECGKYVINEYPDISFVIPGGGVLLDKLQERVRKNGLQDKFKFLGFVDRETLIQLYQNATLYVMPSHYEGLPTVLLEAMSCGLPVIATAVSGNLDVISPGKNGILIPPKSPRKMADAILMLLDDNKTRKELGRNARKTIQDCFTWNIISEKFLKYYNSLFEDLSIKK